MNNIRTIQEAEHLLSRYIPNVKKYLGNNMTLDRMWPLLEAIDNPQNKIKVIHVAGTSGKTSTCYYLSSILVEAGMKVGLTVSPHVFSVTERVQIQGIPLDESTFCSLLAEFLELIQHVEPEPSYFEVLVAFSYWVFAKLEVDYAVIETGLGGLHDGTNVVSRPDKVCVITDIGYDHMNVLGNTLQEIAFQKAGIIQLHNPVFMYRQPEEVQAVFERKTHQMKSKLHIVDVQNSASIAFDPTFPLFQRRNWNLAYAVYQYIASERQGASSLTEQQLTHSQRSVPGRMEYIELQHKKVILDGAHNQQKIAAFVSSFQEQYPHKKVPILIVMKKGKESEDVIRELLPIASRFVVSSFQAIQDTIIEPMSPETIADEIRRQAPHLGCVIELNLLRAVQLLLDDTTSDVVVATGSFYPLAQIKQLLQDADTK